MKPKSCKTCNHNKTDHLKKILWEPINIKNHKGKRKQIGTYIDRCLWDSCNCKRFEE